MFLNLRLLNGENIILERTIDSEVLGDEFSFRLDFSKGKTDDERTMSCTKNECNQLWENIKGYIKERTTAVSFETWFAPLEPCRVDYDAKLIIVTTPIEMIRDTVYQRYSKLLHEAASVTMGKDFDVKIKSIWEV